MGFKEYYKKDKNDLIFEKTFDKFYKRGHFGKIDREEIREQQKKWFDTLQKIIEEKDYGSLLTVVGHRDAQVTREFFTKITKINIKKLKVKKIQEKLKKFCFDEEILTSPKRKRFKDIINEDRNDKSEDN